MNSTEQFLDRLAEPANDAMRTGAEAGFNGLDREAYVRAAKAAHNKHGINRQAVR